MTGIQTIRNGLLAWLVMPFAWTKWEDIVIFRFASDHYLLQGRLNTISGAKMFCVRPFKGPLNWVIESPYVPLERILQIGTNYTTNNHNVNH